MPFPYPTPHGWGAENAGKIGGCSGARAEHPSPKAVLSMVREMPLDAG